MSKIIDADQLVDCIQHSIKAVVISHEAESTKRLFAAVRYFIKSMSAPPRVTIDSKREITFAETESSYFIGTAGQRAVGRGDTIQRAHLSEAAYYDDLEKILAGVSEAAEYGQIDIESTPNGRDAFHDQWVRAKAGRSPFVPIFIPWFIDREYSVENLTQKEQEGLSPSVQEMFNVPEKDFDITQEEKLLVARVKHEYNLDLNIGQLKWRRYKIWDRDTFFWQEYPEDDVSCFLQSGRPVFKKITTDVTKRVALDDYDRWGEELKARFKGKVLYGGVDGAEGVAGGDSHVFSVIEQPRDSSRAHVLFEYESTEPIDVFWDKIEPVCRHFRIMLGVECNGIGAAHVNEAVKRHIPHMAWTTGTNRSVMITDLETAYRKENLIETYPAAEEQARDMVYTEKNRAEHRSGKHDDRVFSRSIAWQMRLVAIPSVTFA